MSTIVIDGSEPVFFDPASLTRDLQIDVRGTDRNGEDFLACLRVGAGHSFLSNSRGMNNSVFTDLFGMTHGEEVTFLEAAYGYPPEGGEWKQCREGDSEALARALTAIAMKCYERNGGIARPEERLFKIAA